METLNQKSLKSIHFRIIIYLYLKTTVLLWKCGRKLEALLLRWFFPIFQWRTIELAKAIRRIVGSRTGIQPPFFLPFFLPDWIICLSQSASKLYPDKTKLFILRWSDSKKKKSYFILFSFLQFYKNKLISRLLCVWVSTKFKW